MSSLTFWLAIGFLGQALFTARFLIQWVVSEKKRDSVVPVAFWWFSLLGGTGAPGLCDFPTRSRDHHRARNGAFRLHAKPDVGGQGKGQTSSVWEWIDNRCLSLDLINNYNIIYTDIIINDILEYFAEQLVNGQANV